MKKFKNSRLSTDSRKLQTLAGLNNRPLESFLSTKYTKRKDYSFEHIFQTPNLASQ